jgi:hypothetical protein
MTETQSGKMLATAVRRLISQAGRPTASEISMSFLQ